MKKILLLLIVSLTLFISCADGKKSALEIVERVTTQGVIPYMKTYECFAASYTDKYLEKDLSKTLYGCDIYDYCSDFAVAISKNDTVSEVHVLVAKSEDAADHLKNCLEQRADVLRDKEVYLYDAQGAENINAMIFQKGLYVCLAAGQSSEIVYEKLCELIK